MFNIFAVTLLLVVTPTVFSQLDDPCQEELVRVAQEAVACSSGNGYSLFQIEPTFAKVSAGEVSKYQIRRYIRNTCLTALEDTQCTRNVEISPDCQSAPQLQLFTNMLTILTLQVDFLCSKAPDKNRVRYLDWVKKDGPSCSADNSEVNACINSEQEKLSLTDGNNNITTNVCTMLKVQKECSELYRKCANKKVYQYMMEISQIISEVYDC